MGFRQLLSFIVISVLQLNSLKGNDALLARQLRWTQIELLLRRLLITYYLVIYNDRFRHFDKSAAEDRLFLSVHVNVSYNKASCKCSYFASSVSLIISILFGHEAG